MNEPLFKNSFVRDEQTAREIYRDFYFSGRFKAIYILMLVLLPLSFLISIDEGFDTFFYVLFCFVIIVLFVAFAYRQNVKVMIARDKERCNGQEPRNELTVFEDRIELDMLENKQTLYFKDIHSVRITKNYINVYSRANFVYIFKKDSFTLGTSEAFVEFLKAKGIKIQ